MNATLQDVIIDIEMQGGDRGALVRSDGLAVAVLTLSQAAARKLIPPLVEYLKTLGDSSEAVEAARIRHGSPIAELFAAAEKAPFGYVWFGLTLFEVPLFEVQAYGIVVAGGERCRRVAEICNAHGTPCSLDPSGPAPGREIDRVICR